jgi:hypothetical protein
MKCFMFLKKLFIFKISMNVVFSNDLYMCCECIWWCSAFEGGDQGVVTAVTESVHTALQTDMVRPVTSARIVVRGTGMSTQLLSACIHVSARISNVWGLWGTSINKWNLNKKCKGTFKILGLFIWTCYDLFCKTWYNKREASLSVLINSRFYGLVHVCYSVAEY